MKLSPKDIIILVVCLAAWTFDLVGYIAGLSAQELKGWDLGAASAGRAIVLYFVVRD